MATVKELEERIRKIENLLTLISREVTEQFDMKLKLAKSYLTREIDTKIEMARKGIIEKSQIKSLKREAEEIHQMFTKIKENFDPYELTKEIKEIRSVLEVIEFRVSHIEKQFKKIP